MALYMDLVAQHYLDAQYGVVSNVADGGCDNYHLFSAEAMLIQNWVLWPQYAAFFKACEVEPGLIARYPGRQNGGISQDEMIGAATLDENAAKRMYAYGSKHWWYFNPDHTPFTLNNWFGRFINFPVYVKQRAGYKLNLLDQLKWSIMTILSPLSTEGDTSGKLLTWSQIRYMKGQYWLTDRAIQFWKWAMIKKYPGGLKQVMTIYFGANHPLTIYAKDNFE